MFLNRGLVSAGTVTMGNARGAGGGGEGRGTPECPAGTRGIPNRHASASGNARGGADDAATGARGAAGPRAERRAGSWCAHGTGRGMGPSVGGAFAGTHRRGAVIP